MEQYPLKHFGQYVFPNVLGMIGLSVYILADTFYVSKALGFTGLAALNFAIAVYCLINALATMIAFGGASQFAIRRSQGDFAAADRTFTESILTGLVIGFVILLCGAFFSAPLARLLGASGEALHLTATYLKTIMMFSPFFILNSILQSFIRNDGAPKLSMAALITGSLSNIVLDYVFMFPLKMGMFGAALATCIAPIISILLMSVHFRKGKHHLHIRPQRPNPGSILGFLSLGLSSFVAELSSALVLMVLNLILQRLSGDVGVAAYGIIANIALVVVSIFTGIAQGIQPLSSHAYGSGHWKTAFQFWKYAFILSMLIAFVIYGTALLFTPSIVSVFNSSQSPKLQQFAQRGIRIYFSGFFFAGFNVITAAFLSAIAIPKEAFLVSIIRGCVLMLPFAFALSALFKMDGVWLCYPVCEGLTALLAAVFLWKIKRRFLSTENQALQKRL